MNESALEAAADKIINQERLRNKKEEAELIPPKEVILNARAVMGAIDFDPWSSPDQNLSVGSARYYNRHQEDIDDIIARDWECRGQKRAFMQCVGAKTTRRLMHKLLREYRVGRIKEAVIWMQNNESICRMPWLWNFPICFPFKRLRPLWYHDELDEFRTFSPALWSFIVYMPPTESSVSYHYKIGRFSASLSDIGRVVMADDAGDEEWESGYKIATKHAYNYRG